MNEKTQGARDFGWTGLVGVHSLLDISDKVAEARFFLGMMEKESELDRFRWLTSACLNACRSALDWLAWNAWHAQWELDGDQVPEYQVFTRLEKYIKVDRRKSKVFAVPVHPLLVEMSNVRQESAHRSSLWIDRLQARPGESVVCPGDEFVFVRVVEDGERDYLLHTAPGPRVVRFCRVVVGVIEEAQEAAHSS